MYSLVSFTCHNHNRVYDMGTNESYSNEDKQKCNMYTSVLSPMAIKLPTEGV